MNGVISTRESPTIDRKPIITCAGELEVFSGLEDSLAMALPQESCEWRRTMGRPVRNVHIGVRFTPFSPEALPRENQWDLIRHPLFHVYWTECTDVESYRSSTKDDIEGWLRELTARGIGDWLIVVVETLDAKRANKLLPRTTVLDRIRADFAPKQGDRCISVLNPARQENRTADSWRGMVARVRYLVLVAYARAVARLEEHVRAQRERRNEPGWHFLTYFRLQEELAQVLEMLGLHDEALVQYDELDALFSQFVVNGGAGDAAAWLREFQRPLERWRGLRLTDDEDEPAEPLPEAPSLLELRAYLYARQARALQLGGRAWETAERCLPFLHASVRELALLEVQAPPGAVSCWLFLAALEVLRACERRQPACGSPEQHSLHAAPLWAYASRKLRELGSLCGLAPGSTSGGPTSEQLHAAVGLSAGMGDAPGRSPLLPSPTDQLKEALCSQEAFNRRYLELSELAVGTYKHVGRLRSARLVGRELASFYRQLGETQKAAAFLGDALKTFEQEGWRELAAQTQLELAACHLQAADRRRYARACAAVAAAPEMDTLARCAHFDEMLAAAAALERPLVAPFGGALRVTAVALCGGTGAGERVVMQDAPVRAELDIESGFPRTVHCSDVSVTLERDAGDAARDGASPPPPPPRLRMHRHLDYRQDGQIASASVVCRGAPLKRADSGARPSTGGSGGASETALLLRAAAPPVALTPGANVVQLETAAGEPGRYRLGEARVRLGALELVSLPLATLAAAARLEVRRQEPAVRLDKAAPGAELLAGLEQRMLLTIAVGSYRLAEDARRVTLACSKGLTLGREGEGEGDTLGAELDVPRPEAAPGAVTLVALRVFAELPAREHLVQVRCAWREQPQLVPLGFSAPLTAAWRLHTAGARKFVQVLVSGQSSLRLRLDGARLGPHSDHVAFDDLNPKLQPDKVIISSGLSVSYMWELRPTSGSRKPLKSEFAVEYAAADEQDATWRTFKHGFDVADYETMYVVQARVEPAKGSEFCRVGALCHLRLTIEPAAVGAKGAQDADAEDRSLMYEVLAEQSVWAVCGRTAGVVSVRAAAQHVTLDVMPLNSGFLPLPLVRLSRYVPAERGAEQGHAHPRLEPFSPGQVYNGSKGRQIHVLAPAGELHAA